MAQDPRYVRTKGGSVVHLVGCRQLRQAKRVHDWHWAEGKSVDEIVAGLWENALGPYLFCRTCFGPEWDEPGGGEGGWRPSLNAVRRRIREIKGLG